MRRLHPFTAVLMALQRGFTGFSIPFFLTGVGSGILGLDADLAVDLLFVLAPLGFVAGVGYGLASYYRFTYEITADTFDIASGVLSRRSREIPYRRVQNVDVSQSLVQRLLGLAVVSIETAGGGGTEATLNAVDEDEAERIRTEIRRRTAGDATGDTDTEATSTATDDASAESDADARGESAAVEANTDADRSPTPLFALETRELLLYALTAFRWGAAVFPIVIVMLLFDVDSGAGPIPDFVLESARPFGGPESVDGAAVGSLVALAAVASLQWLAATYVASALYTAANYYGFRLGRRGNDLVYERGLLQRYSGSIPADKIQSVTITDNPLQRLAGYAGLWVETAGYGPESGGDSQSAVPLADEERVYRFAEALTGAARPAFRRPSPTARRRYLARYSLLAGGVVAGAFVVAQFSGLERWYLAAVVFLAVPPAAHLKYVNLGYFVGEDHLVLRSGFWRRRTTVIPYYRIQAISTRRSIFQRRLGLASLVVDTASSRTFAWSAPTIYDVDLEDAREIHETGRSRLQRALRERARGDAEPSLESDRP